MSETMDRNLALELVRVTEAAAMAAARLMGRREKEQADQAAVDAMRHTINAVNMDGVVVIGEGEKDEAPMLYIGERVGNGSPPSVDVAVDPIDGTNLLANGRPGAISVVAIAEQGSLFFTHVVYMQKIAVGPRAKGVIDIEAPVKENLKRIAKAMGRNVEDLTVVILDRPRHEQLVREVKEAGARLKLISDGDVAPGIMAGLEESGIDVLMGIGGAPEAVVTASALKCLGGDMQCKLWPRDDRERQVAKEEGHDLNRVLTIDDLCRGENVFVAVTGITDGELLKGVRYFGSGARTTSLVMRSVSGTVRWVEAKHDFTRLRKVAGPRYEGQKS
ncbi:MAG: class II fructose-bisphosphatase [candidate division NC10 bacterium]|nr:class II fructose-bisphosphatase [candidate division NC10 bacterium]